MLLEHLRRGLLVELPDAKLDVKRDEIVGVVHSGESYFAIRFRGAPFAELFVQTRKLDGFELLLRYHDEPKTNDDALARSWLDPASLRAVEDSLYTYKSTDITTSQRTWTYELRADELVASKGAMEPDAAHFAVAIRTACTIAARSQRWALDYRELARSIGAVARSEVELGEPIITAERHAMEIEVALLRRRGATERLRTVVSAPRIGVDGATLSLVRGDLERAARPPLPDGGKRVCPLRHYTLRMSDGESTARLDEPAQKLVDIAAPGAVVVGSDRVEVWFDGAPMGRERIDAAIELVARWAVDVPTSSGPYR